MIATLNGRLKLRDPGRLIVETAGVGYEIFVPLNTYYRMPSVGAEVELEIRQIIREDAILLYLRHCSGETGVRSIDERAARWSQALACGALRALAQRSGCCDHSRGR